MVNLVNMLVEWPPVHCPVGPVVPCVFENEEDSDLDGHGKERRERDVSIHAKVLRHGVEEPDLGKLHSEMTQENEFRAVPLLSGSRDFLLGNVNLRGSLYVK